MSDPVFKNVRCLIHNVDFGIKPTHEQGQLPADFCMLCPVCVQTERKALRLEVERLRAQLKVLVAAFDIKAAYVDI